MKVLIWIGCMFVAAVIQVAFMNSGVILGGIPMALLFGAMCWSAATLCKKYDASKSKKEKSNYAETENKVSKFLNDEK